MLKVLGSICVLGTSALLGIQKGAEIQRVYEELLYLQDCYIRCRVRFAICGHRLVISQGESEGKAEIHIKNGCCRWKEK